MLLQQVKFFWGQGIFFFFGGGDFFGGGKPLLGEKYVEGKRRRIMSSLVATTSILGRTHNVLAHALRLDQIQNRKLAVALQAHMPAVHPEMTIWG